jgi:DUF971 family protein
MMKQLIYSSFIFIFICSSLYSQTGITKQDYLQAIKKAEESDWQGYKESIKKWEQSDPAERASEPPKAGRHLVRMPALLYSVTKEKKYAERAREALLNMTYGDAYYNLVALEQIEDSGIITKKDLEITEKGILESAERAVQYWVEWGAMNHATQSLVNNLAAAMTYFPDHPDYEKWKQKLEINVSASWGRWSIEDAQIYLPAWIKPMMEYAELTGLEKEYYANPMTKYYFDYLVQLMTPGGQIVEFGDGRFGRGYTWDWMISVLEKGATIYRDGKMKWAAHRIFEAHFKELGHLPREHICEAYRWADDTIAEQVPTDGSRLVLEDYVGKKVVFRSGWDRNATYLFLNYMDDAPFGIDGKEQLITTINVETEKNHHGHADENAIGLLMKNGCILLYESGYRETVSTGPDGQFRADVFHNKLVVRNGIADPDWRLMPFLLDGGRYKFVNTKLMHFRPFKEVDISRTRLTYDEMGYQWDRLINYLKGREWFIIFDFVKILKDDEFTLANLFYTQNISGFDVDNPIWFDTYYSTIAAMPNLAPFYAGDENKQNTRLLIYFPEGKSFRIGAEQLRNNSQTEWAVYSAKVDSFKAGNILIFTTLLIPHPQKTDPQSIVNELSKIQVYHNGNGYGINLPTDDGFMQINAMVDLEAEFLKKNIRPRYNFESGRAEYGDLITDARYCYLHKKEKRLFYSFFQASKLIFSGKTIFEAPSMIHGQDDGSYLRRGVPKWVAWEDMVVLKTK